MLIRLKTLVEVITSTKLKIDEDISDRDEDDLPPLHALTRVTQLHLDENIIIKYFTPVIGFLTTSPDGIVIGDALLRWVSKVETGSREVEKSISTKNILHSWKRPTTEAVSAPPEMQGHRNTTVCHKEFEFRQDGNNNVKNNEVVVPVDLKRKRLGLTEHQKEVRPAQQGRERDCSGHGPSIPTYADVDFSQGNEESQESQEIRNADSILQMIPSYRC
ncbi:hypothetical protein RJ641_027072 [Dillenia turbinata]|uniref:Uncharacterized protein n=1 Tax=Dillenia turbinata TaxID=194707 RepID=A0AAN8VXM1_9MAGN